MRRREFITLLGSGALARPRAVRAQQPALPVFAFLRIGSPDASARHVAAFRKGLAKSQTGAAHAGSLQNSICLGGG